MQTINVKTHEQRIAVAQSYEKQGYREQYAHSTVHTTVMVKGTAIVRITKTAAA